MSKDAATQYGFFGLLWRLTFAGTLVLALSAAGGFAAVYYMVKTPEAQAPDLLTLDVEAALARAATEGFSVFLERKEPTELLEPGRILSQRPTPAAWVKTGATIHVTVAAKP